MLADPKWWEDRTKALKIARWIVSRWGNIDRKAKDNIELNKLIDEVDSNIFNIEKRIPSWSKYIAFRHPKKRAIYDARTVFSLNWLIYESGGENFFPFLNGENTLLKALDYRLWLCCKMLGSDSITECLKKEINDNRKKSTIVRITTEKILIDKTYAYEIYCDLLKNLGSKVYPGDPWGLTKVEMILFSIASTSVALNVFKAVIANES